MATDFAKQAPPIKNTQAVRVANKMGKRYSLLDAALAGKKIGIKWQNERFTVGDLLVGMHYELEHGKVDPDTNVTNDNKIKTAKIAWAHLKERPDYYTQLMKIDPPKAPKTEKTAFEVLDGMVLEKQASQPEPVKRDRYLKDIDCEQCGYQGPPTGEGRCPTCGAICGVAPTKPTAPKDPTIRDLENMMGDVDSAYQHDQHEIWNRVYGG